MMKRFEITYGYEKRRQKRSISLTKTKSSKPSGRRKLTKKNVTERLDEYITVLKETRKGKRIQRTPFFFFECPYRPRINNVTTTVSELRLWEQ